MTESALEKARREIREAAASQAATAMESAMNRLEAAAREEGWQKRAEIESAQHIEQVAAARLAGRIEQATQDLILLQMIRVDPGPQQFGMNAGLEIAEGTLEAEHDRLRKEAGE